MNETYATASDTQAPKTGQSSTRSKAQALLELSTKLEMKEAEIASLKKEIAAAEEALANVANQSKDEINRLQRLLNDAYTSIANLENQVKLLSSAHGKQDSLEAIRGKETVSFASAPAFSSPEPVSFSPEVAYHPIPSLDIKDETMQQEGSFATSLPASFNEASTPVFSFTPAATASATESAESFASFSPEPSFENNEPQQVSFSASTPTVVEQEPTPEPVEQPTEQPVSAEQAIAEMTPEEAIVKKPMPLGKKILFLVLGLVGVFAVSVVVFFLVLSLVNGVSPAEAVSALFEMN